MFTYLFDELSQTNPELFLLGWIVSGVFAGTIFSLLFGHFGNKGGEPFGAGILLSYVGSLMFGYFAVLTSLVLSLAYWASGE